MMMTKSQLNSSPAINKKIKQDHVAVNAPILAPALQVPTWNACVMLRGDSAQTVCQAQDALIDHHQQSQGHHKHHKPNYHHLVCEPNYNYHFPPGNVPNFNHWIGTTMDKIDQKIILKKFKLSTISITLPYCGIILVFQHVDYFLMMNEKNNDLSVIGSITLWAKIML